MKTNLRALADAMATANPRTIHDVLFPKLAFALPPDDRAGARMLAAHSFRRFADALEHGWRIEPSEWAMAGTWLAECQPDLFPEKEQA